MLSIPASAADSDANMTFEASHQCDATFPDLSNELTNLCLYGSEIICGGNQAGETTVQLPPTSKANGEMHDGKTTVQDIDLRDDPFVLLTGEAHQQHIQSIFSNRIEPISDTFIQGHTCSIHLEDAAAPNITPIQCQHQAVEPSCYPNQQILSGIRTYLPLKHQSNYVNTVTPLYRVEYTETSSVYPLHILDEDIGDTGEPEHPVDSLPGMQEWYEEPARYSGLLAGIGAQFTVYSKSNCVKYGLVTEAGRTLMKESREWGVGGGE